MSDASGELLKQALQARRENRLADAKRDLAEAVAFCRKAQVWAENSDHEIHLFRPDLVVQAIRELLSSAKP